MTEAKWIDVLVSEIAAKHRIIIDSDDPILVTAILNKEIMDQALVRYQEVLDSNQKSLAFQLDKQKSLNEELFARVVERLISSSKDLQKTQELSNQKVTTSNKFGVEHLALFALVFMFGLVLGICIAMFV